MYNAIPIRPQPYPPRGNYNSGNTGTDKDGHNQQGQERQQQEQQNQRVVARGRAEEVSQQQVGTRQAIYSPANNAYPTRQTYPVQTPPPIKSALPMAGQRYTPVQQPIQAQPPIQQYSAPIPQQQVVQQPVQQTPQRNNKVNIAQILKDFRNTMKAISTPPEVETEVNKFLQVVEKLVREPQPQVNLIQSNLKQAAALLDKYISETLNKTSKVVQNWLDALFLQRINYSYNEEEINPGFLVKFPDDNKNNQQKVVNNQANTVVQKPTPQQNETPANSAPKVATKTHEEIPVSKPINNTIPQPVNVQNEYVQEEYQPTVIEDYTPQSLEEEFTIAQKQISNKPNITIIPQDTKLKSLFVEAKKQAFYNNPQKAMSIFKEAFARAEQLKDNETQSRICLEVGKIYDDNDFIVQALTSYHKSLQYTTDTNVKSKAHYSMAQIYDDVNEVEPALEHYITSISYAGKTDDLAGQSDCLTKVANIYTDRYDENAFEYYDVARKLVEQTTDNNMKGYVLSNTADACVQFRKKERALKYYAEAVKNYEKTNAVEEIAQNYKSAAELMINFDSPNKAKSLLKKAMVNAVKTKNEDLISEINLLLASVS